MNDVTQSKHWQWLPGMVRVHTETGIRARQDSDTQWGPAFVPDFDDPATRGCLLHLVREAWVDPTFGVQAVRLDGATTWRCYRQWPKHVFVGSVAPSETDALKAALLAAP